MSDWRQYTSAELDIQYNARATVPDAQEYIARYASLSGQVRSRVSGMLGLKYGSHPRELLDFFPAVGRNPAPILVFIHGGYWRALSKDDSSFPAETFTKSGVAFAAVDYALAPEVSIDEIVAQTRRAIGWLHRNALRLGGDPQRIFVTGSSAGGHLAGMLLAPGWHQEQCVPADVIKGAAPVSGIFELEPLIQTHINGWARLDVESARRNSPLLHLPDHGCPLAICCGERETGEFKRQSARFARDWAAKGFRCDDLGAIAERNHFDVVLDLANADSVLARAVLALIDA
jgi:arylformamidase